MNTQTKTHTGESQDGHTEIHTQKNEQCNDSRAIVNIKHKNKKKDKTDKGKIDKTIKLLKQC